VRIAASSISRFSLAATPPREGLLVELTCDEGRIGQGEATPYPGFSADDIAACERALGPALARLGSMDLDRDLELDVGRASVASVLSAALAPLDLASVPAARFALETALLDLLAQRRGASIASIFRRDPLPAAIPVNGLLIATPDADDLIRRARALVDRGISALKIKLRSPDASAFARDLAALSSLRRELPPPFEIRFDANGAWTLDEARRRLADLAPLSPAFVEQPVAPLDLPALGRCAVPWAADESLQIEPIARCLLDAEGCAAFILKPAALGFLRAFDLASRAASRGLGVVVTHFFDGPVAFAAACELALALPSPPLACGLDPHPLLASSFPDAPLPHTSRSGFITPSSEPGLGLRLRLAQTPSRSTLSS
jgi:L-alanine-DL-glutamate epimerase-like enolase superfamily enzyme